MHDPRVGRFFAVDPLSWKYPHYSSYSFSGNKVIQFVELEGLEEGFRLPMDGSVKLEHITWENLKNNILIKPFVDTHDRAQRQAEWYKNNEHILAPNERITLGTAQVYFATYFLEFGGYTDAEDVSVLTEGRTISGDEAGILDYSLASVGIFIPFVSGGAVKNLFVKPLANSSYADASIKEVKNFLKNNANETLDVVKKRLNKSINTHSKQIKNHENYINNPKSKYGDEWDNFSDERKQNAINHWQEDIKRHEAYKEAKQQTLDEIDK